jgi:asparagine synthase (glutamine-hydrolysing)
VPVGTALSGGLDSSAIAVAVAAHGHERQKTVTAFFEDTGFDERPYARAVVDRTGAKAHWVSFSADELVRNLPAIVRGQGEPFGSTSIAAGWHVMREAARAGLTVMLDGQGGDELFAGYRAAYGYRLADLLARGEVSELRRELGAFWSRHGASPLEAAGVLARPFLPDRFGAAARARLKGSSALAHADLRGLTRLPEPNGYPFPDRLRRHLAQTLGRRGLPELLRYEDRNSMAHSIEARVPFLDHRLVELAYSLDGAQLVARGQTKRVLRSALADLLPPSVRDRRDKLGFVTPEGRFMREALGDLAAETFASPEFRERGLVDPAAARERLERHRGGDVTAGMELWRALNVELWARAFL